MSRIFATANHKADITISGRKATGESEPSYDKSMGLTIAYPNPQDPHPNGIVDDTFFVSGHCPNCTTAAGISATNTKQQFIFAIGPLDKAPHSNSLSAPIRRHSFYGQFNMDMTQAQGPGLPPLGTNSSSGSELKSSSSDHEFASSGHALVMCLAFIIIFPLGVFMVRVLESVKLHMWVQSFAFLLVLLGFITGIVVSVSYNRVSRSYPLNVYKKNR
jgi:hypothetical protein